VGRLWTNYDLELKLLKSPPLFESAPPILGPDMPKTLIGLVGSSPVTVGNKPAAGYENFSIRNLKYPARPNTDPNVPNILFSHPNFETHPILIDMHIDAQSMLVKSNLENPGRST
jgi:hypothetical protein